MEVIIFKTILISLAISTAFLMYRMFLAGSLPIWCDKKVEKEYYGKVSFWVAVVLSHLTTLAIFSVVTL